MATDDVPGANEANNDHLRMGCWAEADQGKSLIFVKSTEDDRVIYDVFDLTHEPIVQWPDAMAIDDFKKHFTYDPKQLNQRSLNSIRWTWHDKTPFPWNKVIKQGARDIAGYADVEDQLAEARKVEAARKRLHRKRDVEVVRDPHTGVPKEVEKEDAAVAEAEVDDGDGMTAAQRVAAIRKLDPKAFDPKMHEHQIEKELPKSGAGVGIIKRIQSAFDAFKNPKG